jgi:hypothetical protein
LDTEEHDRDVSPEKKRNQTGPLAISTVLHFPKNTVFTLRTPGFWCTHFHLKEYLKVRAIMQQYFGG